MQIFHIVDRQVWSAAVERGEYVPAGFEQDGFVHFSFADQVAGVANAMYRDAPDLIVVELDADSADVVVEDCYESGTEFPHVYRPIPTVTAVATHEMQRDDTGDWVFSTGAAGASASPGR
jgi:uncharacterized protein (DUF952 family)